MASSKVKKTEVSIGEKQNLIELCKRCDDKDFIEFIKNNSDKCFPPVYFQNFGWIKLRFDQLRYDFQNGLDPLQNDTTFKKYYDEDSDTFIL